MNDVPRKCQIVLIEDERPKRWDDRHPFNRRANRVGWEGHRASRYPPCGGGRWIIRKEVADD